MRANSTSAISGRDIAGDIAGAGSMSVLVRMPHSLLKSFDDWIDGDADISRPEAIRQLVEHALIPKPGVLTISAERSAAISAWADKHAPALSLPDAIGHLVEIGLRAKGK